MSGYWVPISFSHRHRRSRSNWQTWKQKSTKNSLLTLIRLRSALSLSMQLEIVQSRTWCNQQNKNKNWQGWSPVSSSMEKRPKRNASRTLIGISKTVKTRVNLWNFSRIRDITLMNQMLSSILDLKSLLILSIPKTLRKSLHILL